MHNAHFLPIVLLLAASVLVVMIFRKLKMSPVLGYFFAGSILASPYFTLFKDLDIEKTAIFGEVGIIFLLFAIGLELTFERLKSMRLYVFGFGGLQVTITSIAIASILLYIGFEIDVAVVIGGALSLSSTAIVLQVIAENRSQSTQVGRISLANLLMQDFAVVPLLVLVPLLAADRYSIVMALSGAFFKAIIVLIVIFVAGRLLLRPFFRMISSDSSSKSNELVVATTLLIAIGAALATDRFGLSLAMGAFVAGLLVAETDFQHQAEESILPFKGLFLGLFFMSVGMSINFELIIDKLPKIMALSFAVISVKALIIFALCIFFRFSFGVAIHTGLLLSQGGEFAFILFKLAADKNIIDQDLSETLLLVVTFTMALTPLLSIIGAYIAKKIDKKDEIISKENVLKEIADLENHVIICGFGRVGKMVAKLLEAEHIQYVALDINAKNVSDARDEGFPIYYGDCSNLEMLRVVGLERSQTVIVSINNMITTKKAVKTIRGHDSNIPIIVRDSDLSRAEALIKLGVSVVVPETYETGLQLGGAVLKSVGISEYEVSRMKNKFRAGNYTLTQELKEEYEDNDNKQL
jgi:monovalent cation:H+ antiporter-2, CPA2 family